MNPQNPLEDVRYIRSASNEDILARKVERKPDGPPKSKRNYKEVEGKPVGNAQKKRKVDDEDESALSIFDLSRKGKVNPSKEPAHLDIEVDVEEEAEGVALQPTSNFKPKSNVSEDKDEDDKPSDDEPRQIHIVRTDPIIAPNAPAPSPIALTPIENNVTSVTQSQSINLQEIIDQITDKIYTLKVSGKTDTTVEFKYPPGHVFEGMKVTVTAYDNAAKEFNISFTNLTQEGKNFLEAGEHLNSLKQILDSRGVVVHMIIPTTQENTPIMADQKNPTKEEKDGSERKNRQQQQQQKQ